MVSEKDLKFRTLKVDEVDCRIDQVKSDYATLLLYPNARTIMDILDESVGASNWQRAHAEHKGNLFCSIGINFESGWVWKEDAGEESNASAEKGHASDSFKRAAVNWGIARELYTAPFIKVTDCEIYASGKDKNGDPKYSTKSRYFVSDIGYDDQRNISRLVINNNKSKQISFQYGTGKTTAKTESQKPEVTTKTKPETTAQTFPPKCSVCGKEILPTNSKGQFRTAYEVRDATGGLCPACYRLQQFAKAATPTSPK